MKFREKIRKQNPDLFNKIQSQGGFLRDSDVIELQKIDRLALVLVRCGNGRFLTPTQDALHFCDLIEDHYIMSLKNESDMINSDYVRDISLPV